MAPAASNRRSRRRSQSKASARPEAVPAEATASVPPAGALGIRPRRGTVRPSAPEASGRAHGRLYRMTHPHFITDIVSELRKVVWPSRLETRNLTAVVVIVSVAVGAFLGGVDWIFNRLLENVVLR